ncbi:4'-phosphopantetheinyl transferase family protein [Phyllobacterium leguminum]|uniref:Phosphopantetheinyl transferase n=1 Tax=Phyllobacterium leguminum TaxID=314237 RepID=A0A318SUH8_9HYPH|nr:4'-phosphopantetheinyl transferase superfamily protein [Phyllobacterium leguminum]PYE85132.1 phosphopantetheinyl transferase [Phyllobacterium leguminum]
MIAGVFWLLPIGMHSLPEEGLYASCIGELEAAEINAYQRNSDRRLAGFSRIAARVAASTIVEDRVRPNEWAFSRTTAGARLLRAPSGLSVNIAIADNEHILVIYATLGHSVGVDVELWERPSGWRDIAERFFSKPERDLIQRFPDKKSSDIFTILWTGKEAIAKASGAQLVDYLDVSLIGPSVKCPYTLQRKGATYEKWKIQWLDIGSNLVASCCATGGSHRIPEIMSCDWIIDQLSFLENM